MASYRNKNGGVEASVCVNGIRRSKTFTNKTRAKSWALETEKMLHDLRDGISTRDTLYSLFTRYGDEVSVHKKGVRWELIRLKAFKRYDFARIKLIDLKTEHLQAFIDMRLKSIAGSSVNRELSLLGDCFSYARRWNLMQHNPMSNVMKPKNPLARDRRISDEEIELLLIVCDYHTDRPVLMQKQRAAMAMLFAIETAMRAGEICSLHPRHVNRKTFVATLDDTKNGSKRYVPLSKRALDLLDHLDRWHLHEPLFNFNSELLSATFRKYVRQTGIEDLTFHDTRHEAITRLSRKLDVLALSRVVGHRNINQLLTYYNESAEDLAKLL